MPDPQRGGGHPLAIAVAAIGSVVAGAILGVAGLTPMVLVASLLALGPLAMLVARLTPRPAMR